MRSLKLFLHINPIMVLIISLLSFFNGFIVVSAFHFRLYICFWPLLLSVMTTLWPL